LAIAPGEISCAYKGFKREMREFGHNGGSRGDHLFFSAVRGDRRKRFRYFRVGSRFAPGGPGRLVRADAFDALFLRSKRNGVGLFFSIWSSTVQDDFAIARASDRFFLPFRGVHAKRAGNRFRVSSKSMECEGPRMTKSRRPASIYSSILRSDTRDAQIAEKLLACEATSQGCRASPAMIKTASPPPSGQARSVVLCSIVR